ncbi:hypothetical protein [Bacillus salipaludis]|uniref:hypothetical protein n=1 Tax=Bacillus salipaludis TaxID=2547811 RepID=UPI002E20F4A3|nr:hypothetical protein [Bacillus salipaludis]
MGITAIISTLTVVIGLIISGRALISKTELEKLFFTNEQKIKMYYYKLVGLSGLISILVGDLYILWNITFGTKTGEKANWGFAIALTFVIFICCLISLGNLERVVQNFFIKSHIKFKVNLENIGDVYVLRMLKEDICICSKDPNADYNKNDLESGYILVKLDDLINKSFIKEKHEKSNMSIWEKLLD